MSGDDGFVITVTGIRISPGRGGAGGSGGSGGAGPSPHPQLNPTDESGGGGGPPVAEAQPTPCVDEVPAYVDLQILNNLAKFVANDLNTQAEATGYEWGALLFRMPSGALQNSQPFTSGDAEEIDQVDVPVPAGAIVVGYIHTHPSGIDDQRLPSGPDRTFMRNLRSNPRADRNVLMYVNTSDETGINKTWVYDRSRVQTDQLSCDL